MSQFKTILICESTKTGTDKRLLEKLITKHGLLANNSYKIETKPPGSIVDVKEFLKNTLSKQAYVVSKEAKNILVLVDADEDPARRFLEIKNCFDMQIFEVQRSLNSTLPQTANKIDVGIYLFPDRQNVGSLETLCLKTLRHDNLNRKLSCVDKYITCISEADRNMTENNKSKSKFRIFMATPDPDRYVDSIINHIDSDSPGFNLLKNFIQQAQ